jgi:sulfate adenylyltransferase
MVTVMDQPVGKIVITRYAEEHEREVLRERAGFLKKLQLGQRDLAVVSLIASGALAPLTGFMERQNYESVLEENRLTDGTPWNMPVVLRLTDVDGCQYQISDHVALVAPDGRDVGTMLITDKWIGPKEMEAQKLVGTSHEDHPEVKSLLSKGTIYFGGPITAFDRIIL